LACDFEVQRRELARLARRRDLRRNQWTTEMPCDWAPHQVIEPATNMPFTEAGAWEFIATLLDGTHAFHAVRLRKPLGDIGYETKITLRADLPLLYIKIQFKAGRIWGRSFHNDLRAARKESDARD
jgi:hypothetical protein